MIRLAGICNHNPETTVLAHYRLVDLSGMGIKGPDPVAAFSCSECHEIVDFRRRTDRYTRLEIKLAHAEGCFRTQSYWLKEGLL